MTKQRAELGRAGEKVAEEYLVGVGCEILYRRYRGARKEIDLIAREHRTIVFVEVKTDTSGNFGPPETWVTPRKQKAIAQAAQAYIAAECVKDADYRFDVIGISLRPGQSPRVRHIRGAFAAET